MVSVSTMKMRSMFLLLISVACAFASDNVQHLTAESFDIAVQDNAFLVIQFFAKWCAHCKSLAPEWEEAASILKQNEIASLYGIVLASVDAIVEKSLAEKYQISGFPSIKIFEGHNALEPVNYEGPRQAAGIVEFLLKRASPASTELTGEAEAEALLETNGVIVVYTGEAEQWWLDLAKSKRDAVQWRHTTNEGAMRALGLLAGTITMLKDFEETTVVYKGEIGPSNSGEIVEFIDYYRSLVAMLIKQGDQVGLKIVFEADKRPNLLLFTNSKDKGLAEFTAAAQEVRGKMVSARFHDSDFGDAFLHFQLEKYIGEDSLPKVLIEDRKLELNYLMEGDVNEVSIRDFISDFQDGNLTPMPK